MTNEDWRKHVPKGWWPIFDQLLVDLAALHPDFKISQAKEKFGQLRVYHRGYAPGCYEMTSAATRASRSVCETCGRPAVLTVSVGGSYYSTLCPEHAKQFGFVAADEDPIVAHFTVFGDGSISEVDWSSVPDDPESSG